MERNWINGTGRTYEANRIKWKWSYSFVYHNVVFFNCNDLNRCSFFEKSSSLWIIISSYSILRLFAGFAIAAFTEWKNTVITTVTTITKAEITNGIPERPGLEGNTFSQLLIKYHGKPKNIEQCVPFIFFEIANRNAQQVFIMGIAW